MSLRYPTAAFIALVVGYVRIMQSTRVRDYCRAFQRMGQADGVGEVFNQLTTPMPTRCMQPYPYDITFPHPGTHLTRIKSLLVGSLERETDVFLTKQMEKPGPSDYSGPQLRNGNRPTLSTSYPSLTTTTGWVGGGGSASSGCIATTIGTISRGPCDAWSHQSADQDLRLGDGPGGLG